MSKIDIHEVANYLIQNSHCGMTHRELQKILYFSQGFYLAEFNESLFDSNMEAWKFGPVSGAIWGRFKGFGYNPLHVNSIASNLTDAQKFFLNEILASFLVLGESMLIAMSHTDYPWERNYVEGINNTIDKNLIKKYFIEFDSKEKYIKVAKEKVDFSNLLLSRKHYLSNLDEIGGDWISGGAVAPTKNICIACIDFISALEKKIFSKYSIPELPKVIMGPIPSGGIGIELYFISKSIYLHFINDEKIEISKEQDDDFMENEISLALFNEELGEFLEEII